MRKRNLDRYLYSYLSCINQNMETVTNIESTRTKRNCGNLYTLTNYPRHLMLI